MDCQISTLSGSLSAVHQALDDVAGGLFIGLSTN